MPATYTKAQFDEWIKQICDEASPETSKIIYELIVKLFPTWPRVKGEVPLNWVQLAVWVVAQKVEQEANEAAIAKKLQDAAEEKQV